MKIIALGTGSAFCEENYQTNYVIQQCGLADDAPVTSYCHKNLLIDCGSDVRWAMKEAGLSHLDIDGVYISHAHADHCGGVEWLAFYTYFDPRYQGKPKFYADWQLTLDLWDHTLRGGLEGLQGIDANLETYFDARPVHRDETFTWEGIKFDLVQAVHVSAKYRLVDSFGLMLTDPDNKKRIFITTDVQFAPKTSIMAYYKEADIIIHDCETAPYQSGVHAHFNELITLPDEIKKKMILSHYQDNVVQNREHWDAEAEKHGFAGFAKKGVIYESVQK